MHLVPESGRALRLLGKSRLELSATEQDDFARCQPWSAEGRGRRNGGARPTISTGRAEPLALPESHGRTRMTVFPLRRSVGFKAATASSRVETLPMFVRSRPSRIRW